MLFDLKIEILNILSNSIFKKNYLELWKECLKIFSDKMTIEDFNFLGKIGNSGYLLPDSLIGDWQENV